MQDGSGAIVMDSTCGGTPSLLWTMTGDSVEEIHIASDGEGRIDLPSPRKQGMGASTAPTTTIVARHHSDRSSHDDHSTAADGAAA
jgi:hypothetical protein